MSSGYTECEACGNETDTAALVCNDCLNKTYQYHQLTDETNELRAKLSRRNKQIKAMREQIKELELTEADKRIICLALNNHIKRIVKTAKNLKEEGLVGFCEALKQRDLQRTQELAKMFGNK